MKEDPKKIIYLLIGVVLFLLGLLAGLSVFIFMKSDSSSYMAHESGPGVGGGPASPAVQAGLSQSSSPLSKQAQKFLTLPSSWMSEELNPSKRQGHSLLFDLAVSKKLILERCTAMLYLDPKTRKPIPPRPAEGNDFCVPILWNEIVDIDDHHIVIRDEKQGKTLSFPFKISEKKAQIKVDGLEVNLIPGTRNDLLQRIESLESVVKEKDEAFRQARPKEGTPKEGT
ncbi:MAG: hypothetical protein A2X86_13045 [Bdellovibrionales bacterium GWA2_49_15]|nr:MAG: hypothetical protein A2X86_13045 [Bdellovibrionales bacterium GWA2_49_15]HAZ13449.1 hypothetical protein [Bdellovibrionales bacterium]